MGRYVIKLVGKAGHAFKYLKASFINRVVVRIRLAWVPYGVPKDAGIADDPIQREGIKHVALAPMLGEAIPVPARDYLALFNVAFKFHTTSQKGYKLAFESGLLLHSLPLF